MITERSPDPLGLILTNRPILVDTWQRLSRRVGIKPIPTPSEPGRKPAVAVVDLQRDVRIDRDRFLQAVPIVLLIDESVTPTLIAALQLKIHAVVTWRDSLNELEQAVRAAVAGRHHISTTAAPIVLSVCSLSAPQSLPVVTHLTTRELDVLQAMVDGQTIASTAQLLGIAAKTVEAHRSRVFAKLGARTSSEAVAKMLSHPGPLG